MYFSQLVHILGTDCIQIIRHENQVVLYEGFLSDLRFGDFRAWHDLEVSGIIPMYDDSAKEPYLVIKIVGVQK